MGGQMVELHPMRRLLRAVQEEVCEVTLARAARWAGDRRARTGGGREWVWVWVLQSDGVQRGAGVEQRQHGGWAQNPNLISVRVEMWVQFDVLPGEVMLGEVPHEYETMRP